MLDIGVYPISLSFMVFGKPSKIITECHLGETGVDEQAAYVFKYSENQMAVLHSSLEGETAQEAFISGTEGTPQDSQTMLETAKNDLDKKRSRTRSDFHALRGKRFQLRGEILRRPAFVR